MGKTIEAGLLISQKCAEKKNKILIICPANLRKQWNQELFDKFFLDSIILENKNFNEEIKKKNFNPFNQDSIVISSYQFIKTKDAYVQAMKWDLVVIDEAHRLRNVYLPKNKTANAIKDAVKDSPKVLLTATPLQNSLLEMYGLSTIIDEHFFGDLKSFKTQYLNKSINNDETTFHLLKERLKSICQRTLRKQVLEYIPYTKRIALVQEFIPNENEDRLYQGVSNYLQRDKLYALPNSQRNLMTLVLRKLLASSTYAISNTLLKLAVKLEKIYESAKKNFKQSEQTNNNEVSKDLQEIFDEFEVNFETFSELREEFLDNDDSSAENQEVGETKFYNEAELLEIQSEIRLLRNFYELANSIEKNSKGEKLLTALSQGFQKAKELKASPKAIIFTESTKTQNYIYKILSTSNHQNKVVLFNGSNNDEKSREIYKNWIEKHRGTDKVSESKTANMRQALVDYFKEEADIMIATEAAAEGINLQFCSLVINYDLPWNPQRIEQRIGRCHRYGQKFDVVVINFLNKKNAADQRVYELLNNKFKLFEGIFGASDEVLGAISSGIDFEKRIADIYQTCRNPEEINKAFDELQSEFESSIDESFQSAKQKLLENFDEEVREKLKISKSKTENLITKYHKWLWDLTKYYLSDKAVFNNTALEFTLKENPFPQINLNLGPYSMIGRENANHNIYRSRHPLAKEIINRALKLDSREGFVEFNYSQSQTKISILKKFIGKSGYLSVELLKMHAYDDEEVLLLAGHTDTGESLSEEEIHRLFSLEANVEEDLNQIPDSSLEKLSLAINLSKDFYIANNEQRNAQVFDEEIERLERWADDKKLSIEVRLKELELEIKQTKKEAIQQISLEAKLNLQRKAKDLEKKRKDLRFKLYDLQDAIDIEKENLISMTEQKLKAEISLETVFRIKWALI